MTKSGGRVSVVFYAIFSLIVVSCADKPEPIQEMSSVVGPDSKPQDNLVGRKLPAPNYSSRVKSTAPSPSIVTKGAAVLGTQSLPPTSKSVPALSSSLAPDISELIGMNSEALNRLLGKPLLVRREAETEVWQYRTANCVLHLFLYPDATTKLPYRVVHVEANHSRRSKTVRAGIELNLVEQTKWLKLCFGRLFHQAKATENSS